MRAATAYPTMKQAIAALLLAPLALVGTILFDAGLSAGMTGVISSLVFSIYAFIVAEFIAVFLGIPILAVLYGRLAFRLIWCVIAGALIAAIPSALVTLTLPQPDFASVDGRVIVSGGHLTQAGFIQQIKDVMLMAGLGIIAGIAFWAILRLMLKKSPK